MKIDKLFLLGDIHGDWSTLHRYIDLGVLDDSLVIQVGDFALGFEDKPNRYSNRSPEKKKLDSLNKKLKEHNVQFWAIRGNHCDPSYWQDPKKNSVFNQEFSNITLIPDYYSTTINDKKFLFVGGGVSVDRHDRTEDSFWEGEVITSPRFPLTKHDVLISHACPSYFNFSPTNRESNLMKWAHKNDPELQADLIEEREIMDHVASTSEVTENYSGHFHNDCKDEKHGIKYRCLDIDELMEYKF